MRYRFGLGLTLLLIWLAPVVVEAQRPKGVFGGKGGLNASALHTGDASSPAVTRRTGMVVGLYLEAGQGAVALRPELLISPKGATLASGRKEHQEYLDGSVLVVLRLPSVAFLEPFLAAGPTVSYCRVGCGDRELDLGGALGGGFSRQVGELTLMLEGRYTYGVVDYLYSPTIERAHRVWSVTAGAGFGVF